MSKNARFWYARIAKNMGHENNLVFNGRQIARKTIRERKEYHRKSIYWYYLNVAIDFPQSKDKAFIPDRWDKREAFDQKYRLLGCAKGWRAG